MTDWYIGSAGRWISMTFCTKDYQSKKVVMREEGQKKYLFEIDLGVGGHPSVADEVDDPFLAFIRGKVETGRKVALRKNEG